MVVAVVIIAGHVSLGVTSVIIITWHELKGESAK